MDCFKFYKVVYSGASFVLKTLHTMELIILVVNNTEINVISVNDISVILPYWVSKQCKTSLESLTHPQVSSSLAKITKN